MSTYQPPKGLKPGDTVRVVGYSKHQLRVVATVGWKWLTLERTGQDPRPDRIDLAAGRTDPASFRPVDARVYRLEDPAGWADVHRITTRDAVDYAAATARRRFRMDSYGYKPVDQDGLRAVIDATQAALDTMQADPTCPEDAS